MARRRDNAKGHVVSPESGLIKVQQSHSLRSLTQEPQLYHNARRAGITTEWSGEETAGAVVGGRETEGAGFFYNSKI